MTIKDDIDWLNRSIRDGEEIPHVIAKRILDHMEAMRFAIIEVVEAADGGGWDRLSPGLENQRRALDAYEE